MWRGVAGARIDNKEKSGGRAKVISYKLLSQQLSFVVPVFMFLVGNYHV